MNCINGSSSSHGMIRATTPVHAFAIAIDPDTLKQIKITYKQRGAIILEKNKDDCSFTIDDSGEETKYICSYRLTQEETNLFSEGTKKGELVSIQMRVLTNAGQALASDQKEIRVDDVLNDEVLT